MFSSFSGWLKRQQRSAKLSNQRRLCLETLEDRVVPTTFRVLGTGDATASVTPDGTSGAFTAPTLRAAIDAANDETRFPGTDTIQFDLPGSGPSTILAAANDTRNPFAFGPTAFVITSAMIISGPPTGPSLTLSGNNAHRLFGVMAGATLTLENLTLADGYVKGGDGGDSFATYAASTGGGAAGLGGAIFNNGTLYLYQVTLTDNVAQGGNGGNMLAQGSSGLVNASGGGGVGGKGGDALNGLGSGGGGGVAGPGTQAYWVDGIGGPLENGGNGGLNENGRKAFGAERFGGPGRDGGQGGGGSGAGYLSGGGNGLSLSSGGFGGGGAGGATVDGAGGGAGGFGGGGGGGYFFGGGGNGGFGGGGGGASTLNSRGGPGAGGFGGGKGGWDLSRDLPGTGGGGGGMGGALFNNGGTVIIVASTFANNTAQGGNPGGRDQIRDDPFGITPEPGAGFGGAVFSNGGSVTVISSTFTGNLARGGRGYDPDPIYYPLVYRPVGPGQGGAIFNRNGSLTVASSTLSLNQVLTGAGSHTDPTETGGRAIYTYADGATATVNISHSILGQADTLSEDFSASAVNGGVNDTNGAYNLIRRQTGFLGGIVSTADPLLGVLSDNGGRTPTMPLLPGSPALNAGGSGAWATDQRGVARPQGSKPDLGAFEVRGIFALEMHSGDGQHGSTNTTYAAPLVVRVVNTAGDPVAGGRVTFTGPASGPSTAPTVNTATVTADGLASLTVQANAIVGPYTVTASLDSSAVTFQLTNVPQLDPVPVPLPFLSNPYYHTFTANGGTAPYSFALGDGQLPTGLNLRSDGVLEGTPTTTGSFYFTVLITDANTPGGPFVSSTPVSMETLELAVSTIVDEDDSDYRAGDLSLREAIKLANLFPDSTTITFAPALTAGGLATLALQQIGDTTAGPSALAIRSPITILGPVDGPGVEIKRSAAAGNMRLFVVDPGADLTLQNVSLSNGIARGFNGGGSATGGSGGGAAGLGGAIFNRGSLILANTTLADNTAQGGDGGHLYPWWELSGGEGGGGGGGLASDGANSNSWNGGAGGGPAGGAGEAWIQQVVIYPSSGIRVYYFPWAGTPGGWGGGGGGGLEGPDGEEPECDPFNPFGCEPRSPIAGWAGSGGGFLPGGFGGGGGGGGQGGTSYITEYDAFPFTAGPGGYGGDGGFGGGGGGGGLMGGLIVYSGEGLYLDVQGWGGSGGFGGGAGQKAAGYTFGGRGGGGAGMGGAIFSEGGSVTIQNSTLTRNTAQGGTGGNAGQGLGGAIFNHNGTLTILNSTLSNNTAADGGRGIFSLGDGATATATINNSILGQADLLVSDFVGQAINGGTSATSGAGNLIRTALGFDGTVVSTADPLLAPLADNGGPTWTMALLPGSPAYNSGTAPGAPSTDQRGLGRVGTSDIGAFEVQTPPNQAPVIANQTFSLAENQPNLAAVDTVFATDPDVGQQLTYAIAGGNTNNAFAIDPASGALRVNNSAALDYESTPSFTLLVTVTDNGSPNLSTAATITINLTNVNETPYLNGQTFSLVENSATGTKVGCIVGSDPDAGQQLTYTIIGGNTNGAFAIDPTTGRLTVANPAALDYETTPSFTLIIQAADNGSPNLSTTAQVVIHLQDINEGPTGSDVTGQIALTRGGYKYNRTTGLWEQAITLKNSSTTSLTGTFQFVVENLTPGVTLATSADYLVTNPSTGRYVVTIPKSKLASLAAGQRYQLNLFFSNPLNKTATYDWRLFADPTA